MFLSDWFATEGNALAMSLNRWGTWGLRGAHWVAGSQWRGNGSAGDGRGLDHSIGWGYCKPSSSAFMGDSWLPCGLLLLLYTQAL
jgi:hypothetical protein